VRERASSRLCSNERACVDVAPAERARPADDRGASVGGVRGAARGPAIIALLQTSAR
jgi:hypothetical protein